MSSPNATASAVSGQDVTLSTILAGPYRMTYAIPLLIISIPLALAGSFLTLDRTRSFIPKNALKKGKWRLEGGIGGIAAGWVFGVHLSTFLALLIMNRTSASPLGPVHFLVIWVLSAASLSVVSGRWKVATLIFLGITGGTSLSLLLSVVMSPKITARLILLAVLTPINTACCLVPVPAVQHGAARFSAAITGSFGIILSAAQLGQAESWANVWMRLWIAKDADWGNSVEKGLSAAMCILCLVGITCDWLLKRRYGENPDQKWDSYLASYTENILNGSDRAGSFTPSVPFWKKVFGAQSKSRPILFPSDSTLRGTPFKSKLRSKKSTHAKRFRPIKDEFMSGSSSESEGDNTEPNPRPWAKRSSTTLSGATLLGAGAGKGKLKPIDDYSDGESVRTREKPIPPGTPGWRPAFFMRHASSSHRGSFDLEQGNNPIVQSESPKSMSGHLPAPVGGVPATPSLIRAIDRLALAQSEAYGTPHPRPVATPDGSSSGDHWKPFWQEVRDKAEGTDSVQTPR